jgi:hypothetical protein
VIRTTAPSSTSRPRRRGRTSPTRGRSSSPRSRISSISPGCPPPYQTHFETIFATRQATGRIRAIVRMLPAKHEALEARAAAALAAARAADMAEADHAKGQRPIEAVVAAHAALVGQQREFIRSLEAYNLDIAEYAMAVADLSVPDDRFVSMLIGTPIQSRPQAPEGSVPRGPGAGDAAGGAAAE